MMKRFFIPVLALLIVVAGALIYILQRQSHAPKSAKELFPVVRTTLANGLEILVVPTNRVPAITHMLWVKAGGADDPADTPGMAHFLEHLMFSGTPSNPKGAYDSTITKLGGEHNAFTSNDFTAYYATVPKEHLETVMALEVDRLTNLTLSDDSAAREIKVISEERRMRVDNQPASQLAEQLRAVQFLAHPYRQPIIGWADSIERYTAKNARAFRKAYYRASNMVLIVVGDVDPQQLHKLAANHYGKLPTMPKPERRWAREPELVSTRSVRLQDARVAQPRFVRTYTVPSYGTTGKLSGSFTLDVLGDYLGAPRTGVLYRALVRDQAIATEISVRADGWSKGPGSLSISMALADNISTAQAEAALNNVLEQVTKTPPPMERLAQAKVSLSASALYAQDGLMSLANVFGELAMLDLNEDVFYGWQESIHAVSPQDVSALATHIFTRSAMVNGYLEPARAAPQKEPPHVPLAAYSKEHAHAL